MKAGELDIAGIVFEDISATVSTSSIISGLFTYNFVQQYVNALYFYINLQP